MHQFIVKKNLIRMGIAPLHALGSNENHIASKDYSTVLHRENTVELYEIIGNTFER